MTYIHRYDLEFNPFIKGKKDILIETSEYKEAIYRLNYLLKTKGFGLITGEPGRGKTTIIRNFAKSLSTSLYKVIYTSLSTLTVLEFYKSLAAKLELETKYKKNDNFNNIQAEIKRCNVEKRITPVIIIDEANYINNAILNDLKLLFNFDMDSINRAVVILVGLPQINNTLRLVSNEALKQRITMNYSLESLTKEESKSYILESLKIGKSRLTIFTENAIEAIVSAAGGIPRIINKICDACLLIGHNKDADEINNEIVMMAVDEIELG